MWSPLLNLFRSLALLAACTVAACVVTSFVFDNWIGDLCSQLRLVWCCLLLPFLVTFAALRMWFPLLLLLAVFLINAAPILSMYLPYELVEKLTATAEIRNGRLKPSSLSLLNFNTEFQHNNDYQSFASLLRRVQPDVLVLSEVDKTWFAAVADYTKAYPYSQTVTDGAGLALYSKFPISKGEVRYFGKSHHPRIFAQLQLPVGIVNLVLVHPPTPQSEARFIERNKELNLIASEIGALAGPTVLVGDLNCGPWSMPFAQLLSIGLHDSEQGFGPQPTWPARAGRVIEKLSVPPLVPIDHVLVSNDIEILERTVGPTIGSDHLPVFVKITVY